MDAESQNFDFLAQAASDSLYDLSSQFRKVQKLSDRNTGAALAQELARVNTQTKITTNAVSKISDWPERELDPRQQAQKREIGSELEQLLHRVRSFQSSISDKLKQQQRKQQQQQQQRSNDERTPLLDSSNAQDPQQQQQQQVQVLDHLNQTTVDIHSAQISDRDTEILEIQRGAREINAIFRDLGILVTEQGQQLDNVEDNIADLARQTESASRQLVKAENYQRSRGKCTFILLFVLLIILIIVMVNVL